jgi:hypothetical protein
LTLRIPEDLRQNVTLELDRLLAAGAPNEEAPAKEPPGG